MDAIPSGTVSFLFTDIEGSTKRWEAHPQAMSAILARHDAILRSSIEGVGGFVFKTMGDAFYAAFSSPAEALDAALAAQRALGAEARVSGIGELRVRMALHTGIAEMRGGDYFGQPLNRAARLLPAGHGGQILVSQATQELVRDGLPPGVGLISLGEHRLKDLIRPEQVYQVTAAGLATGFPALRSLDSRPNNLPRQTTPLVGREREIGEVCALVRGEAALVTLTGPGGTGKTRLALQAGAELLDVGRDDSNRCFPDGVWFVELAALRDTALVVPTMALALGVDESPDEPLVETLQNHLKERKILLILDNFEQVEEASGLIGKLLGACAGLKVLATSRSPLDLKGEREYPVPPLTTPDPRRLPDLPILTQFEAVRLFIERAIEVKPGFAVSNDNAPAIAEICARLDGLPLAIELAATRIRMFPPQALLGRLGSRLAMLTGGAKDLPERQRTLRGAIEWSYDLLDEGEKRLFRRLGVFQGGRRLEGIEVVCGEDCGVDLLGGVEALVRESLLQQREGRNGEPRFWMLETIHEYARDRLKESGEEEELRLRHARYYMNLSERSLVELEGKEQEEWLALIEDEHDNMRAVLDWAADREKSGNTEAAEIGLRTASGLWRFWYIRGHYMEAQHMLETSLGTPCITASHSEVDRDCQKARGNAINRLAIFVKLNGDLPRALKLYEEALAIRRELGDKIPIGSSLNNVGEACRDSGDLRAAVAFHEEGLSILRECGASWALGIILGNLGIDLLEQGKIEHARNLFNESLQVAQSIKDQDLIARAIRNLGFVAVEFGDLASACRFFEEYLSINRRLGGKPGVSEALLCQADVAFLGGELDAALRLCEESAQLSHEIGDIALHIDALLTLALIAKRRGNHSRARRLLAEGLAMYSRTRIKSQVAAILSSLGSDLAEEGAPAKATSLLGAAAAIMESKGAVFFRIEREEQERGVAAARAALGEETFAKAWEEGRALEMEDAIALAVEAVSAGESKGVRGANH